MHHTIFTFALVLFLAACSITPLPQATAVIPTNPPPTSTDTPQPTFTPEPTLTPTPIPEPFVIRDNELMAWDKSLGKYQRIVLSNGALPEGALITENEIKAADGAVLYRFDTGTGDWAFTVPADIQAQVQQFFGEPGTLMTQADGTLTLIRTDGTILAQETENGWKITENPKQVEASLGYENITDGTFVNLPGTETPNLLVSEEQGVLGFYDYANESWESTKSWKEAILADEHLYYLIGNLHEDVMDYNPKQFAYDLWGVTDGVMIEKPFEIKTATGELIATNELAYQLFYLDAQQRLQSIMVALVVKLPDGSVFPIYNPGKSIEGVYGDNPTLEQMKDFYKQYVEMPGRIVEATFWATPGDIDKLLEQAEANEMPVEPGSNDDQRFQLAKIDAAGRLAAYQKLVEYGDPGLGVILASIGSSASFGVEAMIVALP